MTIYNKNVCGTNLKKIRQHSKLSQTQLAAKSQLLGLDIDKKIICLIENDKRHIHDYELVTLAEALKVPIGYLIDGLPTYMCD